MARSDKIQHTMMMTFAAMAGLSCLSHHGNEPEAVAICVLLSAVSLLMMYHLIKTRIGEIKSHG